MMARRSSRAEGRNVQDEAAAIPRQTVTAAALVPPPVTAVIVRHLPPLPPQRHPAALLGHPAPDVKGGVAAPLLTNLGAGAAAPIDTAVRRSGTGGGAATTDQHATRKSAVIPGSAEAAGVDPDLEGGTGVEPGPEIAAAERGRGAGRAETTVAAEAVNTSKRPPAKRGGGRGVTAMRKTRKGRIRRGKGTLIKRKTKQKSKRRKRAALWFQKRTGE